MNSVDQFESAASEAIKNGASNLLIDLTDVQFMSSAGIRSINSLYYRLHPKVSDESEKLIHQEIRKGTYEAPHLKLLNPQKRILDSIKMVGLDMYLGIYSDEFEAIAAFQ